MVWYMGWGSLSVVEVGGNDGWMDGWTDGRTDGWMDSIMNFLLVDERKASSVSSTHLWSVA